MHKQTLKLTAFSAYVTFAVAQTTITLYDLSLPVPSSQGTGLPGQLSDVLFDLAQGAGDIEASAVAVDSDGFTYYIGERPVSVVPTTVSGRLTTAVLPTPFTETLTFRADASRIFNQAQLTTTVEGVKAEIDVSVVCTHDVDDDTSVEDAEVVCHQKGVIDLDDGAAGTTIYATTTGDVMEVLTVTNAANLTLPTTTGEPIDVAEPTSRSGSSQVTNRPTADPSDDEDEDPTPSPTGEADPITDDGAAAGTKAALVGFAASIASAALALL